MTTGRIGFQGAKGANSEIAIRDMFPKMEAVPHDTLAVVEAADARARQLAREAVGGLYPRHAPASRA